MSLWSWSCQAMPLWSWSSNYITVLHCKLSFSFLPFFSSISLLKSVIFLRPCITFWRLLRVRGLTHPLPRAMTREFYIITRHEVDTDLIFPCMCRRYLTRVWSWAHSCEISPARTRGDKRRVPKSSLGGPILSTSKSKTSRKTSWAGEMLLHYWLTCS